MGQSMGTLDFFLLEGGEYLERLDGLAQAPAGQLAQGDELVRLARAFRGSAIMASQHGMARAAQGLESCVRAVRESRVPWDEAIRGELIRAIDDCKVLMRRLRTPDQGDTEKAEAIGIALDRLSGRASAAMRAAAGPGLDAGGRAFVAREAASIASVLQNVARTLRGDPANRDVLVSISPSMSALRGVAILNDLPPLGDILSATEHATKDLLAASAGAFADAADVFEAGGKALARAAREVVDAGRPDADAEESRAFTARLFHALTGGGPVTSVEALFYDDEGPHIIHHGTAPRVEGAGLARVEMVSHGEYLNAASAELTRAETPVQRDLRLFGIAASVRPMMSAAGSPLSTALGRLAEAARDAIGRGAASHSLNEFVNHLKQAATALAGAQSGDEQSLADGLGAAAAGIAGLTTRSRTRMMERPAEAAETAAAAATTEPVAAARAPEPVAEVAPPAPPLAAAPEAQAAAAAPPPPAPTPAPMAGAPAAPSGILQPSDLHSSYLSLEQLIAERGLPMGTLDELVAGGAAAGPPRISARLTPPRQLEKMAPEIPVVPVESLAPDEAVVPVETLLYDREAAWYRLQELKPLLAAAAVTAQAGDAKLAALISEVFDLVELSRR